ncbi:sel1 repeat family protein [bacterium]|nr:sel1 repeat family protein [bacterium]
MKLHGYPIILLLFGLPATGAEELKSSIIPELQAAAERGEAEAQYQLSRAYLRGDGVSADPTKAFALMKASAEQGFADAIGGVGYFYSAGKGVGKDEKQAVEWFRKGAEKGSARAQFNLGTLLLDSRAGDAGKDAQSPQEGLQWIVKAADQKFPEAALAYGRALYQGKFGLAKEPQKAVPYLEVAAGQGIPNAQNLLGSMYESGSGVEIDLTKAADWYRKAALQGHLKAQANFGRVLGPSSEDPATRTAALAWLLIAMSQGEVTAEKALEDASPGLKDGEMESARSKAAEFRNQIVKPVAN